MGRYCFFIVCYCSSELITAPACNGDKGPEEPGGGPENEGQDRARTDGRMRGRGVNQRKSYLGTEGTAGRPPSLYFQLQQRTGLPGGAHSSCEQKSISKRTS